MGDTKESLKPFHNMARSRSPAQLWSYRVPSPPRVVVPPPALTPLGLPDLHIDQSSSFDFESSGFANAEFLKTVTYGDFMTVNNMIEWRYEQRRMAQQILPFLFLGPVSATRDSKFLQDNGITMVLAVRNTMSAHAKLLNSKAAAELGIQCNFIDVAGNQELIAAFPKAIELINAHLSSMYQLTQARKPQASESERGTSTPGKVLVFCESGNERSATVVAAYLMAMYSMDLIPVLQIVQAQRFAVAFDESLKTLLQTYNTILRAKRDVVQASYGYSRNGHVANGGVIEPNADVGGASRKSTKRTLDEADDDMDTDADEGSGMEERFEKREGHAPFQG